MNDERSFVEQIREDPHDVMPRLIYADFLEDSGDPRGELIRVQVELAEMQVGDPRRPDLVAREQELLEEHGEAWLAPLRELGAGGVTVRCFQRGLLERVRVDAEQFLATGDQLCRMAPALYCLELTNVVPAVQRVAQANLPLQITALDLSSKRLGPIEMRVLASAGWWDQISLLQLKANRLADEGVAALTARALPHLESLSLDMNQLGASAAESLANWPTLAQVRRLSLSVNRLGDPGVVRLCRSAFLDQLERLDLASNGIEDFGVVHLASTRLAKLRELNLRANRIGEEGTRAIAGSPLASRLQALDLRGNNSEALSALEQTLSPGVLRPMGIF